VLTSNQSSSGVENMKVMAWVQRRRLAAAY
jgi:hypothetical protein